MLHIVDLGRIDYADSLNLQKESVRKVAMGGPDVLFMCEHPKTISLGRSYKKENIFLPQEELLKRGFVTVEVDRGGDVTLHAPGQLVLYAVVDLKRAQLALKTYLHKLEEVTVDLLADFAIVARGNDGNRGVWIGSRKIASIGIGVRRWVTYHGVGINISTDMSLFQVIRPCGLDVKMTSLAEEVNRPIDMGDIKKVAVDKFKKVFGYK